MIGSVCAGKKEKPNPVFHPVKAQLLPFTVLQKDAQSRSDWKEGMFFLVQL